MRQRRGAESFVYDEGPHHVPDDENSQRKKSPDAWHQLATDRGQGIMMLAHMLRKIMHSKYRFLWCALLLLTLMVTFRILWSSNENNTILRVPPAQLLTDTYDVMNCPLTPPKAYPREYPILDVLRNWNPRNVLDLPEFVYQGVCVLDVLLARNETFVRQQILNYRDAEVPFVVRNDPAVRQAVALWKTPGYLSSKLKGKAFQTTLSNTTIMTYFSMDPQNNVVPDDFVPFTRNVPMSFDDWNYRAHRNIPEDGPEKYAYLRLDACLPDQRCDSTYRGDTQLGEADFMYEDLAFFHPHSKRQPISSLVPAIMNGRHPHNESPPASKARGIQCRMATPGLTAEAHFDNERNTLVMLRGARRYLLGHPRNCPSMHLYPPKHPLERHTQVDWRTVVNEADTSSVNTKFSDFAQTTINEVILQEGDVLYLPTYWFHHIVSLTYNYQCNTRSGYSVEYDQTIYDCGFFYDFPS